MSAELECPCCGDVGAVSDLDGLFHDGQPLLCGCDGHVSIDTLEEELGGGGAGINAEDCLCMDERADPGWPWPCVWDERARKYLSPSAAASARSGGDSANEHAPRGSLQSKET